TAAGEVAVEPRLKAVAEDRFEYEIDFRTTRRGSTRTGDKPAEAFLRDEHWTTSVLYRFEEEVLEGYPDLRMAMSFERMTFLLDLGRARYSGYIGPEQGNAKSAFHEVHLDGSRTETNNIPG